MERNELALYIADITDADLDFMMKESGLSFDMERLVRISKSSNLKVKQRLAATGHYLHKVLEKYELDISQMAYSEHGKPFVANNKGVFFNLSHSGAYLVIAVSGQPVGVDLQKKVPFDEKILKKICRKEEALYVTEHMKDSFNYVWALKEAASKLNGDGITYGVKRFTLDYSQNNPEILLDNIHYGYSSVERLSDDYVVCLVCKDEFKIKEIVYMEEC